MVDFLGLGLALVMGLCAGLPMGVFVHVWVVAKRKEGTTMLIGVDPERRDIIIKHVKPKLDGSLPWRRGKQEGRAMLAEGTALDVAEEQPPPESWAKRFLHAAPARDGWTVASVGRAFIINRRNLIALAVDTSGDKLCMVPDDGFSVGQNTLGVHERNVANSSRSWLEELVKYTVPILIVVAGLVFGCLYILMQQGH